MEIQANKIYKNFLGTPLFEDLNLLIDKQEKLGLVGQNGTGKTTLFQILLGKEGIGQGTVSRKKGLKIGWIPQQLTSEPIPIATYIYSSFNELQALQEQLRYYEEQMCQETGDLTATLRIYGELQQRFEEQGGFEIEDRISRTLKGLGIDRPDSQLDQLSGGQRVRVELAKILVQDNDVLLLDEPTNHLDLRAIEWLENFLKNTKCAYVVISHDRAFLDHVTKRIVEIEDGQLISYPGNYSRYVELKKARLLELSKSYELQQKEIQRLRLMIRRYRQWGKEGDNESFFKKAKEIERRIEKLQRVKPPITPRKNHMQLQQSGRSGKEVLIAREIGKIMADRLLFSDSSFTIYRGERLAVIGENGSGKSTLIKAILGEIPLDEGEIRLGASIKIGYLPQKLVFETPMQSMLDFVKECLPDEQQARQTLAKFNFYGEDVTKRIKDLSGGEQVRLYLLKLLQKRINFLLLDEPTNHLDIYVRQEIEALLATFTGTLIAVTHDRYFIQKNFDQLLVVQNQQVVKTAISSDTFFLD